MALVSFRFGILFLSTLALSSCQVFQKSKKMGAVVPNFSSKNIKIHESKKKNQTGPCEPSIAINPLNTQQVAAGSVLDNAYYSEDGGVTWQTYKLSSSLGVYGDPVIIADYQGNFYYAHLSDPEKKGWSSKRLLDRIVIQKSTDGGKSYDDGTFTGMRHPKDQDKHWLVADLKTNAIYCTWTEFDLYDSKKAEDKSRILFSKSTDAGATWSDAVSINQFEGDCRDGDNTTEGAVPAPGPNGEVYVAWAWNEKIWFDRSTDGGKTWLEKDIIVADQPGGWDIDISGVGRVNGMPVLVSDLSTGANRGTLYVNWSDQRKGAEDTDIWLSKSTDGGTTWSAPLRVNNDKPGKHQFFSWMAIDQVTGNLFIVFYDRRNHKDDMTDVYLAISKDGGQTFSNHKISESPFLTELGVFFGDYNCISAHDGMVRPIWTRQEGGILSVWTALIPSIK